MNTEETKIKINLPDSIGKTATTTINNSHLLFVTIEQDQDATNPLEEGCNGKIYSLGRRHSNFNPDAVEDAVENNPDHVKLSYFEHGQCRWSVQGDTVPGEEFQWDGTRFAGVWVPDADALSNIDFKGADPDPTARRARILKYAKGVTETYTQWCNGEVYGYTVKAYKLHRDPDGARIEEESYYRRHAEPVEEDSCWGFYGWDYTVEEIKRIAEGIPEGITKAAPEPEFVFHNVAINISAKDAREAYTKLCNALGSIPGEAEWTTDTYSKVDESEQRPVSELYPQEGEAH